MSMLDDKSDRLPRYAKDDAKTARKRAACETLKDRAVAVYDDFLRQCVGADQRRADDDARSDVAKLDDADLEAYLLASFYAARLSGKRWVARENLDHSRDSSRAGARDPRPSLSFRHAPPLGRLARYRKCEADATEAKKTRKTLAPDFFDEELKLVREMVALLPSRIAIVAGDRVV